MNPEIKKTISKQTKITIIDGLNKKCKKVGCKWFKRYGSLFNYDPLSSFWEIEMIKRIIIEKGCYTFAPHRWCKKRSKVDEIAVRKRRESRVCSIYSATSSSENIARVKFSVSLP